MSTKKSLVLFLATLITLQPMTYSLANTRGARSQPQTEIITDEIATLLQSQCPMIDKVKDRNAFNAVLRDYRQEAYERERKDFGECANKPLEQCAPGKGGEFQKLNDKLVRLSDERNTKSRAGQLTEKDDNKWEDETEKIDSKREKIEERAQCGNAIHSLENLSRALSENATDANFCNDEQNKDHEKCTPSKLISLQNSLDQNATSLANTMSAAGQACKHTKTRLEWAMTLAIISLKVAGALSGTPAAGLVAKGVSWSRDFKELEQGRRFDASRKVRLSGRAFSSAVAGVSEGMFVFDLFMKWYNHKHRNDRYQIGDKLVACIANRQIQDARAGAITGLFTEAQRDDFIKDSVVSIAGNRTDKNSKQFCESTVCLWTTPGTGNSDQNELVSSGFQKIREWRNQCSSSGTQCSLPPPVRNPITEATEFEVPAMGAQR